MPLIALLWIYAETTGPVIARAFGSFYDLEYQLTRSVTNATTHDAETFVLGNSRMFRGVDPSVMSSPTYNFAFDDDSFDYYSYKLDYLLARKIPFRNVIIGVDSFQLHYRNYDRFWLYRRLLDHSGSQMDARGFRMRLIENWIDRRFESRFLYRTSLGVLARKILQGESIERWEDPHAVLRDDGFYAVVADKADLGVSIGTHGAANADDMTPYLERALEATAKQRLKAFVVTPPRMVSDRARDVGDQTARAIARFAALAQKHGARYIDFSADARFSDADFADFTHLNTEGAQKFARILDALLREPR